MKNIKKRNASWCRLIAVAMLAALLISVLPLGAAAAATEYKGEILQQPTAEDPRVLATPLGKVEGYQWYIRVISDSAIEITPDSDCLDWDDRYCWDDENERWIAHYDECTGFKLEANKGEIVDIHVSEGVEYVACYDSMGGYMRLIESENGIYTYEIPFDGEFEFGAVTKYDADVKGYFTVEYRPFVGDKLEGETSDTLKSCELGEVYWCDVTFDNGDVVSSKTVDMIPEFYKQPTVDDPTALAKPAGRVRSYAWYTVGRESNKLTDESEGVLYNKDALKYDGTDGWTVLESDPETVEIQISAKNGDIIKAEFDTQPDGVELIYFEYDVDMRLVDGEWCSEELEEGVYTLSVMLGDCTSAQIYRETYVPDTAIEGENGPTLSKLEAGESYMCIATYDDGTKVVSEVVEGKYTVLKQPSLVRPDVRVSLEDMVESYQWCRIGEGVELIEITDETEGVYYEGLGPDMSVEYTSSGWTYFLLGYRFAIELDEGERIVVQTTDPQVTADYVGLADTSSGDIIVYGGALEGEDGYFELIAPYDDTYIVAVGTESNIRAFSYVLATEPIEGQTSAELTEYESDESYICEITYKDGTVIRSSAVTMTQRIIWQPTAEDPEVTVSFADKARYQWYSTKIGLAELTPSTNDLVYESVGGGDVIYLPDKGWQSNAAGQCFVIYGFEEGDTLLVTTDDETLTVDDVYMCEPSGRRCASSVETDDGFLLTGPYDGTVVLYVEGDAYVRVYTEGFVKDTAIAAQTSARLSSLEVGKSYVCEISYGGDTVLTTDIITVKLDVTEQPTAEKPTASVNLPDQVESYEWIKLSEYDEVTDESDIWFNHEDTYDPDTGWSGDYYDKKDAEDCFIEIGRVDPDKDTVFKIVTSKPIYGVYTYRKGEVVGNGNTWYVTVPAGNVSWLDIGIDDPEVTARIYVCDTDNAAPIAGQNTATFTGELGDEPCVCRTTCVDGTVVLSVPIVEDTDVGFAVTKQPTAKDCTVEVSHADEVVEYLWYEVTARETEETVTDKTVGVVINGEYSYHSAYDEESGQWYGTQCSPYDVRYFEIYLKKGQKLVVELSEGQCTPYLVRVGDGSYMAQYYDEETDTWHSTATKDGWYYISAEFTDFAEGYFDGLTLKATLVTPARLGKAVDGGTATELYAEDPGYYACSVVYDNGIVLLSDVIAAAEKAETPVATYDAASNKLTGLVAGKTYIVTVDGTPTEVVADENGCIAVQDAWVGKTIGLAEKGSGDMLIDSDAQSIQIPAAGSDGGNADGSGEGTQQSTDTEPPVEDGTKGGLPAIAIVAIVIGSVAVVGGGGTAVYLLVIKKKRV